MLNSSVVSAPEAGGRKNLKLKLVVLGAAIVGVLAIGSLFGFITPLGSRSQIVSFEFSSPGQVLVGQPFTLGVSFSNPSDKILKNVKLIVALPSGISFLGQPQDQRVMEQTVGDLGPGSLTPVTFNMIATDGAQSLKRLSAKLQYGIANSSAEFEDKSDVDIVVGPPAIGLTLDGPAKVFSGEDFEMKLAYQNNSSQDFKNLKLRLEYPPFFKFKSSSLDPDSGNNEWNLGGLVRGAQSELTIRGNAVGPEQSFFGFQAIVTADFSGQTYAVNSQALSSSIAASALSVSALLNGSPNYVAGIGQGMTYEIHYRNNSQIVFQNITVRATITSELFDIPSVSGNAFFNSVTNTLTWTPANSPQLASLAPGQEGVVAFTVGLKQDFPIRRLGDKNYILKLQTQVESPTVPPGTTAAKTISVASLENKVAGQFAVDARAYFRDAASGILNDGPYPPKVNQPTQYTIHWLVFTKAADMSNMNLSASLQSGARWTGKVKTNIAGSEPVFDSASGRVTWNIPNLPANRGTVGSPAEAIFQIEATPPVNQVGGALILLDTTQGEAHDDFADLTVQASDAPLDTSLSDDQTIQDVQRGIEP